MNRVRMIALVLLVGVLALAFAQDASAQPPPYWYRYMADAPADTLNDLHILFSGTGGTIGNVTVYVNGAESGTVVAPGGNEINVEWSEPLAAGDHVRIVFSADFYPISLVEDYWTDDGSQAEDANGTLEGNEVPATTPWGLLVLSLALIGLAAVFVSRRRRVTA